MSTVYTKSRYEFLSRFYLRCKHIDGVGVNVMAWNDASCTCVASGTHDDPWEAAHRCVKRLIERVSK